MIRRIATATLAVASLGLAGLFLLARRPAIGPVERPTTERFSAESIAQGEALAAAGHCASCHTRPGGQPYTGGYVRGWRRFRTHLGSLRAWRRSSTESAISHLHCTA